MPDPLAPPASLRRVQEWMLAVIEHPGGAGAGLRGEDAVAALDVTPESLSEIVLPSETLTPEERLEIYANAYFLRLEEVLGNEFPTVHHLLGDHLFGHLVQDYLLAHPPAGYSLNTLGRHFPAFLASDLEREVPHRAFAADVALVERTMDEVFDAQAPPPLEGDAIQSIPPERWAQARITPTPALRMLLLDHPVNEFISAVRDSRPMEVPDPAPTWTVVYRNGWWVWRCDQEPGQQAILAALQDGATLQSAIERAASTPGVDADEMAASLGEWFADWGSEGLFVSVDFESPPAP